MQTIEQERTVTATTTDMFGGTLLRVAPGPGAIAIYVASTVADSTASINVGGKQLKAAGTVISKVGTNAPIDVQSDAPMAIEVRGGEVISVDVTIVTAGTIRGKALWVGEV